MSDPDQLDPEDQQLDEQEDHDPDQDQEQQEQDPDREQEQDDAGDGGESARSAASASAAAVEVEDEPSDALSPSPAASRTRNDQPLPYPHPDSHHQQQQQQQQQQKRHNEEHKEQSTHHDADAGDSHRDGDEDEGDEAIEVADAQNGGDDEQQQQQEEQEEQLVAYGSDGVDDSSSGAASQSQSQSQPQPPVSTYKMPEILKVVLNREQLEAEQAEDEERELAAAAGGGANANGAAAERSPEQVVFVQVVREDLQNTKPFLGGFRHKYYGTLYHHAGTQTARRKKQVGSVKFNRETQTVTIVSRSQQTAREAGTQMERSDLLLDTSNDKVILSRPYVTAAELDDLRDRKATEVQCFLRQCFAWRRVRRLRESQAEQLASQIASREAAAKEQEAHHARQIDRRMHPRTAADFKVLLGELEAWRAHETARIKSSLQLSAEQKQQALQELLAKEVALLQTIDRLRITAGKENASARTKDTLEKMASPKEWSSKEGDKIEVDTPFTVRAKELVDLYNGLCLRNLPRPQRVDVLLHLKYTVKEFDCALSREIVELIRREEDLLRRQRPEQSLEGCRKRLQNLFLQFVNTPAFNPEAANFQRTPDIPQTGPALPTPALASSLAKPAMLAKTNTITVSTNAAGRLVGGKR